MRRVAQVVAGAGARRTPLRVRVGHLACGRPVRPPLLLPRRLISREGAKPDAVVCSGTDSAAGRVLPDSRLWALPRAAPAKPWRLRTVTEGGGDSILQRPWMCTGLPLLQRSKVSRTQRRQLRWVGLGVGLGVRRPMGRGAGAGRGHAHHLMRTPTRWSNNYFRVANMQQTFRGAKQGESLKFNIQQDKIDRSYYRQQDICLSV